MDLKRQKEVEEIIGKIECPKGFLCYQSGFETLCSAKDIGLQKFLLCLNNNPQECTFSIDGGDTYFCECPLRIYIAKKIRR